MTAQISIAEELRTLGLTVDLDEHTAKKIKGALLIIEGRLYQGAYREALPKMFAERLGGSSFPSESKLYGAAYHAVAKEIVRADTAPEVLTEIIPTFLLNFSKQKSWHPNAYDLKQLNRYIHGPVTEWQGKQLRLAAEADKPRQKLRHPVSEFPKRAEWLKARFKERNWGKSEISRHSGPDRKTITKILNGEIVREDVLDRLARALSTKGHQVDITDIPSD